MGPIFCTEKQRWNNPHKRKARAKHNAGQGKCGRYVMMIDASTLFYSGRGRTLSTTEAARCPNAGRISSSKQNSLFAEPSSHCDKGCTYGFVLTVCVPSQLPSVLGFDSDVHFRYPNLSEVRMIPTKKDIAFIEYADEASSTVAKEALHNYKLDGEQKIKVR